MEKQNRDILNLNKETVDDLELAETNKFQGGSSLMCSLISIYSLYKATQAAAHWLEEQNGATK